MRCVTAGEALDGVVQDEAERVALLDAGARYAVYGTWEALKRGQSVADLNGGVKGYVAVKVNPDGPAPTVAKMPASWPNVYGSMHWLERRKFTVPELKRLCSFPDEFVFLCGRFDASAQLGNSVMPFVMREIAGTVRRTLRGAGARG